MSLLFFLKGNIKDAPGAGMLAPVDGSLRKKRLKWDKEIRQELTSLIRVADTPPAIVEAVASPVPPTRIEVSTIRQSVGVVATKDIAKVREMLVLLSQAADAVARQERAVREQEDDEEMFMLMLAA